MLVVDMKMPEHGKCDAAIMSKYGSVCLIAKMGCAYPITYVRPKDCPIKGELPEEHGDLIDRDVSIQTFNCIEEAPYSAFDGQEAFYTPEDVVNTLLCQDVVVAAERKDDGTTID